MKKNLSAAVVFTVILCCLIYLIQFGIDTYYHKTVKNKFTRLLNHEVDADIMIFGSSIAYHQMDPDIIKKVTGKQAYNMAWDGLFFIQYNALIKEYLEYTKRCRYIVIACDFENLGKNELITRPDLFLPYLSNKYVYDALHAIEPAKMAKALYVPGYKFTLLNKSFYNAMLFPASEKGHDGFDRVAHNDWQIAADTLKPFQTRYDPHIYELLKSTINQITNKGIKVVIVLAPLYKEGYKMIINAEDIKSKYKALVNKDVYFLDYTQDTLSESKSNFVNYSHLNPKAAEIFSYTLANGLRQIITQ